MKIVEVLLSMPVSETKHWMVVMRQLTGGGTPTGNNRERWQKFRWAMMTNHERLQAEWDARAKEIDDERTMILTEYCGGVKRSEDYEAEMAMVFKCYGEYRDASGKFCFARTQERAKRGFSKCVTEINDRYQDVGKAAEKFKERQAQILSLNIEVRLLTCDYSEVPDDVGCAYISFIRRIIMGMPKLRFWHSALMRESRVDPEVATMLVGRINEAVEKAIEAKKLPGEITMDVFRALYEDPKMDAPKEAPA